MGLSNRLILIDNAWFLFVLPDLQLKLFHFVFVGELALEPPEKVATLSALMLRSRLCLQVQGMPLLYCPDWAIRTSAIRGRRA